MSELIEKPEKIAEFLPAKVPEKKRKRLGDKISKRSWNSLVTKPDHNVFYRRMLRHMENDQWKAVSIGFNVLLKKFKEADPWAMEFVRDTLDGKPGNRIMMNPDGNGKQITITINADDAALL